MVSSRQLLVLAICLLNIAQTSITSSPLSPPTLKIITTGSTIRLMVKTLTKCMQSDFVEEISSQMFAVVASTTPQIFLHSVVPIRRKQYHGTRIACYATQTTTYLAPWKAFVRSVRGTNNASADVDRLRHF
jgi:hypothetical protein